MKIIIGNFLPILVTVVAQCHHAAGIQSGQNRAIGTLAAPDKDGTGSRSGADADWSRGRAGFGSWRRAWGDLGGRTGVGVGNSDVS